jgi:hypothetical protein
MAIKEDHAAQGGVWDDKLRRWEWRDEQGQLHRVAGPASIWSDGTQVWYLNGEWHRVDEPAVIHEDGAQWWYQHGVRHRVDGPAVIRKDGHHGWHVQGQEITGEVLAWMRANSVTLPFNDAQRVEFALRWL